MPSVPHFQFADRHIRSVPNNQVTYLQEKNNNSFLCSLPIVTPKQRGGLGSFRFFHWIHRAVPPTLKLPETVLMTMARVDESDVLAHACRKKSSLYSHCPT